MCAQISVSFSDLARFTTMCELQTPELISNVLSRFFAEACSIIHKSGGCASPSAAPDPDAPAAEAVAPDAVQIIVPADPGGGWDQTGRAVSQVLTADGIVGSAPVTNIGGAGGTVGLQRLVNEEGNEDLIMQMGLGVVGSVYTNESEATLQDTTPLARLIEEAEAIVVTGSLIARPDYQANSPIVSIGSSAIEATGQLTVERALSQMPQFAGSLGQSNTATTGTITPTHTEGARYDGDNGVQWQYLHSGYGWGEITGFTSTTVVDFTVISRIPADAVGSGNASTR